ncbi:hypothetical protein ASPSYDRAFT_84248 [Aspergillus sydowii CBS 593.65]|uniref:Major facilitator superfamily (MFS) profile domain-containing protein n=1 Tax=Aspergillus sydowii CBS 593.65 TaxID=1036612 RepID=A0A1L9TXR6_9EURO|nr:uncharacterized protein ASPSYDRAFT_84248 [Aspergillus sydowii CBS 593.65]OJJ64226.1 hypothetical protein ASPSYDRAFT_84248 [Aspergillus sydowii CBS 593.65]
MAHVTKYLICAAVSFGLLGSAKGLDEALIATTVHLPSFISEYQLDSNHLSAADKANRLSNITSMVQLGSLPGALLAFFSSDWIGPLWTMRQICLLWVTGVIVAITSNGSLGQLLAGRFLAGMGIGQASIVGPIYLAEVAPSSCRGLLVCIYGSSEYIGVVIGYFAGYGASIHLSDKNDTQWILPQSSQLMMAGVLLLASLGCVESPRHLVRKGCTDKASDAVTRLRRLPHGSPRIEEELQIFQNQATASQATNQQWFSLEPWKLLFGQAANRSRLLFLVAAQLLSQWSGTNAITTYTPKFFSLLSVTGNSETLLTTSIFGVVKLVAGTVSAIFFVDRVGRKRVLLSGITLQLLALLYVAIYITATSLHGVDAQSGNVQRAAIAAIVSIYVTGIGYAFGWNSVQYLINAEILPSPVRTLGTSLLMFIHYAIRFALVKAVPSMMLENALQPKGTFWFFFGVAFLGLLWAFFLLPETSHRNLEETSEMIS